jgi:hypothetical protein
MEVFGLLVQLMRILDAFSFYRKFRTSPLYPGSSLSAQPLPRPEAGGRGVSLT